jgi:hypothetical protein
LNNPAPYLNFISLVRIVRRLNGKMEDGRRNRGRESRQKGGEKNKGKDLSNMILQGIDKEI